MYWSRIFTTAMAAGVFVPSRGTTSTTATAFAPAPVSSFRQRPSSYFPPSVSSSPSQSTMVRMVGSGTGWDNHNFLDSLGRGPEDRQKANDDYFSQSRFGVGGQSLSNQNTNDDDESYSSTNDNDDDIGEGIRGAQITQDMKAKMKSVHTPEEERFQGGQMFRRVLEKAQTAAPSLNVPPSPTAPPPPIPRTPVSPTNMSLEQMTVEEQAQMFRQMMMMQQQQQQQQQPPPVTPPTTRYQPPPLEPMRQQYPPGRQSLSPDGKRVGRNRDADAINNTSDVYFAQLKRDSTSRIMARLAGDDQTANQVFADPAVHDIKLHSNPYFEEARKQELLLLETSPEEMIKPEIFRDDGETKDITSPGIKYKDVLAARRQKLRKVEGSGAGAAAGVAASSNINQEWTAAATTTTAIPSRDTLDSMPRPMSTATAAATTATTSAPNGPLMQSSYPSPATTQPLSQQPLDRLRQDVRTLQGMLLKHRGGPGFGAGRLRGADIDRFETLANHVIHDLKQEASSTASMRPSPSDAMATISTTTNAIPSYSVNRSTPLNPQPANTLDKTTPMIACLEGAILVYKNCPVELRESVLITLRAALLAAVKTCDEIIDSNQFPSMSPPQGSVKSIDSMIAVMEGAILMYKNSPPELQSSVLVTLRVALMAAVTACNAAIANNEVQNVQAYQAVSGATPKPPMMDSYSARPRDALDSPPPPLFNLAEAVKLDNENSVAFEAIYKKLQNVAGDGKMGLRNDLSPSQAADLVNELKAMKALLVEELMNDNPDAASG